jgi:ABC-type glycerol-3-phosphate transport system permease component
MRESLTRSRAAPENGSAGSLMAAVLITLPIDIVYNIFVERFIEGFTVGGVK